MKVSTFLELPDWALARLSKLVEAFVELLEEPAINGALVFLKIEGDKHFFPPSKSLISCSLSLFIASDSKGSPRLDQ